MSEPARAGPMPAGLMLARRWTLALSVGLTLSVPLLLLLGPAAYRLGVLDLDTAMWGLAQAAFMVSLFAVAASLGCIVASAMRAPKRGVVIGVVMLTFAMLAAARLWMFTAEREALPPMWDVQTDWAKPVEFGPETLIERQGSRAVDLGDRTIGASGGAWAGKTFSQAQDEYYSAPDVREPVKPGTMARYRGLETFVSPKPVDETRRAVEAAMKQLDWKVSRGADRQGPLEASHTSAWYGLVSDIVVRVEADGAGSRVDARSASRTGAPDMGANAGRLKSLMDALSMSLRPPDQPPSKLE